MAQVASASVIPFGAVASANWVDEHYTAPATAIYSVNLSLTLYIKTAGDADLAVQLIGDEVLAEQQWTETVSVGRRISLSLHWTGELKQGQKLHFALATQGLGYGDIDFASRSFSIVQI